MNNLSNAMPVRLDRPFHNTLGKELESLSDRDLNLLLSNETYRINVFESLLKLFLQEAKRNKRHILKAIKTDENNAKKLIKSKYRSQLDRLELILYLSTEISENVAEEQRFSSGSAQMTRGINYKYVTALQLHGRGLLIAKEILALLNNGFPNGGLARWRSLYEIAVISSFLSSQDQSVSQMYLDYAEVERYEEMKSFNVHAQSVYGSLFSEKELNSAQELVKSLCEKYGEDFKRDLGWARCLKGIRISKFSDIENLCPALKLRPYYKWANNGIHGGPKGVDSTLGNEAAGTILIGRSNSGFSNVLILTSWMIVSLTEFLGAYLISTDVAIKLAALSFYHEELLDSVSSVLMSDENY